MQGEPFESLQQLMAVLPPYSSHALPPPYRELMLTDDSEIMDFYPSDFRVDVKGKRFAWLGEVLLPLIDPNRLKTATKKLEDKLSAEEKERNKRGNVLIFKRIQDKDSSDMSSYQEVKGTFTPLPTTEIWADKKLAADCAVHIRSAVYEVPEMKEHICDLLKGVVLPSIDSRDVQADHSDIRL